MELYLTEFLTSVFRRLINMDPGKHTFKPSDRLQNELFKIDLSLGFKPLPFKAKSKNSSVGLFADSCFEPL